VIPRSFIPLLTLLATFLYIAEGNAMSILFGGEKSEVVLFSPLEGKLTYKGEPASGATFNVWIAWKDQEGEVAQFTADGNGYFSIPTNIVDHKANPLVQISIAQSITVNYEGNDYVIWKAGKSSTNLYGELGGRPENVMCELTKEEMDTHLDSALLETSCVWSGLVKEKE